MKGPHGGTVKNLSFFNHRQKWEGLSNALRCPTAVLVVKVRSTEGRGRGAKAEIISDSVINGPRRVAVLCFSSESDTGTWRGQQSGRGARQGRIVTAVRIRQSDCRHSKQDVTYPSAGILLLPFSGRPRRGEKKRKKSYRNIFWDHSSKASDTQHGAPDASSYPCTNTQSRGGRGSSCGPHVVREGLAAGRQCLLGDN